MLRIALSVLTLLFTAFPAVAQLPTDFERILIPIVAPNEMPGAFGSRWVTRISAINYADRAVLIRGYDVTPHGC